MSSQVDYDMGSMSSSSRFWDRLADRYAGKPVPDEAAYEKKLNVTREYFRPDMDVLEFGCGTGSTAIRHAPFVGQIHAIDTSRRMLEIAEEKARAGNVRNITFEHLTIEDLDAKDARYDVVLGLSILHLLEDPDAAIAKVHRLLKPGGVFVSSTACLGDRLWFFKAIGPVGRLLGLMPLIRVFTVNQLVESLTGAGFGIVYRWQPGPTRSVFIVAKKM